MSLPLPEAVSKCASCNAEDVKLYNCSSCKVVQYCGVACQKAHRKYHESTCLLYRMPDTSHDCNICCLPMPFTDTSHVLAPCCGHYICSGCYFDCLSKSKSYEECCCPYCRCPISFEGKMSQMIERARKGDANSLHQLGLFYLYGTKGIEINLHDAKACLESAAAKGSIHAHRELGNMNLTGIGTEVDEEKAKYHYGIAAMKGDYRARHSLAHLEKDEVKKIRHLIISASQGSKGAMDDILQRHKNDSSLVRGTLVESTLRAHISAQKSFDSVSRQLFEKVPREFFDIYTNPPRKLA